MGNPNAYVSYISIIMIVCVVLAAIFFAKHAKVQKLLARWSGGEYVERNSRFNMLVFHGLGALTLCALTTMITYECLANTAVSNGTQALIYVAMILASFGIYHFLVSRYCNPNGRSRKTMALEVGYGILAVITSLLVFAIFIEFSPVFIVVCAFMFWLRYPKVQAWVSRRAAGHYTVPDKRYGKIMLHGFGTLLAVAVGALAGFLVAQPFKYLFSETPIFIIIWLVCGGVAAAVYGYYTLVLRKRSQSGATPMQVQWEILWGTCMLWGWIFGAATLAGAIALAVMAIIALLVILAVGVLLWIIMFFTSAEERTVSTGGLFSHKKKEYVMKNFDGSYTDIAGNTYKEK